MRENRYYMQQTGDDGATDPNQPQVLLGSGFRYILDQFHDTHDNSSSPARAHVLLQQLLRQHGVDLNFSSPSSSLIRRHTGGDDASGIRANHSKRLRIQAQHPSQSQRAIKTVDPSMSDETVLQAARQIPSEMSLLGSLLRVLDDSDDGTVSARAFLKTCALTVRPGLVPSHMDAKEMVLAALHFLCQCHSVKSNAKRTGTPYMCLVQVHGDLEKCVYAKQGDWSWSDDAIKRHVMELEDVFYSSGADLKWIPRMRFCPQQISQLSQHNHNNTNSNIEEDLLLLKGTPPQSLTKKVVRKKKTSTGGTTTGVANSTITSKANFGGDYGADLSAQCASPAFSDKSSPDHDSFS